MNMTKYATNEVKYDTRHDGLLSYMGYHVGNTGLLTSARRSILDRVMESTLPNVVSSDYMCDWKEPRSQARLKKLADSIAGFRGLRLKKMCTANDESIRDWTNDLTYLKNEYWDGSWQWRW